MRAAFIVAKREIASWFASPVAYVVLTAWVLICGISYYFLAAYFAQNAATGGSDNPLTQFFGGTTLFYLPFLVMVPVLTMRLIAEETRSGSLEALLTAPVSSAAVIVGKYIAALVFWMSLWVPTLLYVWITSRYGDVDLGAIASSYLGVFGIGVQAMALGLLMSTIAPNQIIAAVLTFLITMTFFVLGIGQFIFLDTAREVLEYISIWNHMSDFSRGIVDTRHLVFDASVAAVALFLAHQRLESRRIG
ncbi:MAG: ABC transporter permease [Polyangiaceae bacterium]|nr:ABC transporter permease [Polyangiaceae bacterium]